MSDYGKIASVLSGLALALDNQEVEAFRSFWTEDGVIEMHFPDGSQAPCPDRKTSWTSSARMSADPERSVRHFFQTPSINVSGDAAEARFYALYIAIGRLADVSKVAEYRTQLRRGSDGSWRIAKHNLIQYRIADGKPSWVRLSRKRRRQHLLSAA
jgi:ketosteroid isomerase-like protein